MRVNQAGKGESQSPPAPGVNRLTKFVEETLFVALLPLVVGLGLRYGDGSCETYFAGACREYNWEWTVGTTMAELSVLYLVVIGGIYGLIRLLGAGRLRGFLDWFWRGE